MRIAPYNTAILAASYEWRNFRVGVEVTDLFDSTKITNLGLSGTPKSGDIFAAADQIYFQPGRQITGDVTMRF
jgi:iron complex outermembrane receptor protein